MSLTTSLGLFANTALIASTSAVLALVLGIPTGRVLQSMRPKPRRLLGAIIVVPFVLPAFLIGLSFLPLQNLSDVYTKTGMFWIALAHAFMNFGFIARVTSSVPISKDQMDAARLDGAGRIQLIRYIEMPVRLAALRSAALLVALYSATSYGLILVLGKGQVRTLETEIAIAALQNLDLGLATILAVLQTVLTLLLFLLSRSKTGTPSAFGKLAEAQISVGIWSRILTLFLTGSVILVLGTVIVRSLTLGEGIGNYALLATQGARDILDVTLIDAGLNSVRNILVALAIALPLGWILSKSGRGVWVLILGGVSPVVFGLLALVSSGYLPRSISGSWLVLPIVQSLFLLPLLFQILRPAREMLSRDLISASQLDGAGALQRLRFIELPLLKKPLIVATSFSALAGLGEFGASSFLSFGSQTTLPVAMVRLLSRPGSENLGMALAAGSLFILFAVCMVWLVTSEGEK